MARRCAALLRWSRWWCSLSGTWVTGVEDVRTIEIEIDVRGLMFEEVGSLDFISTVGAMPQYLQLPLVGFGGSDRFRFFGRVGSTGLLV